MVTGPVIQITVTRLSAALIVLLSDVYSMPRCLDSGIGLNITMLAPTSAVFVITYLPLLAVMSRDCPLANWLKVSDPVNVCASANA